MLEKNKLKKRLNFFNKKKIFIKITKLFLISFSKLKKNFVRDMCFLV